MSHVFEKYVLQPISNLKSKRTGYKKLVNAPLPKKRRAPPPPPALKKAGPRSQKRKAPPPPSKRVHWVPL
jgi:hypothetical protein